MTDTPTTPPVAPSGPAHAPAAGAGQLLRQYRDAAGLHIVSLAAALKVSRAKIEALETERYDELPDVAFARALAMSCCRYLGKEVEPVLALMPSHAAQPTPGLRPQVPVQSENLSRPRFQQSRGPFNHATVPPWVIWALVIAVIVVGGWFAASPQRAVVKAPASALDIPPQGLPGAEPVLPAQEASGAVAAPNAAAAAAAPATPATPAAPTPANPALAPMVQVPVAPAVRIEPVNSAKP